MNRSAQRMNDRSSAGFARKLQILMTVALAAVLAGCTTTIPQFELVDDKYLMRPGSIAVISGRNYMFDLDLADAMTGRLKSESRLTVMDQVRIKSQLKQYPADLITSPDPEQDDVPPYWFDASDAEQIAAFQRQLKTDYIMVVWGDGLHQTFELGGLFVFRRFYGSNIHMRLFEFPSRKIIGYAGFFRQEVSIWSLTGEEEMVKQLIEFVVNDMVEGLVSTTKMRRPRKR